MQLKLVRAAVREKSINQHLLTNKIKEVLWSNFGMIVRLSAVSLGGSVTHSSTWAIMRCLSNSPRTDL